MVTRDIAVAPDGRVAIITTPFGNGLESGDEPAPYTRTAAGVFVADATCRMQLRRQGQALASYPRHFVTLNLLQQAEATLRRAAADADRAVDVEVDLAGHGGGVRLDAPVGAAVGCESVTVEINGPALGMWVRSQLIELTDGDMAGMPYTSELEAVYAITRAVIDGDVSWTTTTSRAGGPWKERIAFLTPQGSLEWSTDFGRPLLALHARKTHERGAAYPRAHGLGR